MFTWAKEDGRRVKVTGTSKARLSVVVQASMPLAAFFNMYRIKRYGAEAAKY
jgi:hypothetical protein